MKIPISDRLLACASLVSPGARVADVGTDHGYLGIWLIRNGVSPFVLASDLREQPLAKARTNAERFKTAESMEFVQSDGLHNIIPTKIDTVICAGMGGDCIIGILAACPWVKDERFTLILQPQSGGQDLRRWLAENGFGIEREILIRDSGFLYTAMLTRFGKAMQLSPGQQYVSPWLLQEGGELLEVYITRILKALTQTVAGIEQAAEPDREKLAYYRRSRDEIEEMRNRLCQL